MALATTRRRLLTGGAALSWFLVNGSWLHISAAQARAAGFSPQTLTGEQCETLEVLADELVPGARDAGIAPFIDSQLTAGDASLLIAKYLGVPPEQQLGFYQAALDSGTRLLATQDLSAAFAIELMGKDEVLNWQGAPASFFSFVLRADALDAVYGTEHGFEQLGIPYRAHISPQEPW